MPNINWSCHKALRNKLSRRKVKHSGKVATLLLETFIDGRYDGKIRSKTLIDKGIIKKGEFTEWRKEMEAKDILSYQQDFKTHRHWIDAGKLILPFINEEKFYQSPIATEKFVKSELAEIKEEVALLKKAMKSFIEQYEPPYTEEKLETKLKLVKTD